MEKYRLYDSLGTLCTAVIYSPGWGAGFSTWLGIAADDERVVRWLMEQPHTLEIEAQKSPSGEYQKFETYDISFGLDDLNDFLATISTGEYPYRFLDAILYITLIPVGTMYRIKEYDGAESIEVFDPANFATA